MNYYFIATSIKTRYSNINQTVEKNSTNNSNTSSGNGLC